MREPTRMELRVANALFDFETKGKMGRFQDELNSTDLAQYWIESSRAAIRAMREPTHKMIDAYSDPLPMCCDEPWNGPSAKDAWQAMIDAASPQ